jgi:hypothetical protein
LTGQAARNQHDNRGKGTHVPNCAKTSYVRQSQEDQELIAVTLTWVRETNGGCPALAPSLSIAVAALPSAISGRNELQFRRNLPQRLMFFAIDGSCVTVRTEHSHTDDKESNDARE